MKRTLQALLVLGVGLLLTACGGSPGKKTDEPLKNEVRIVFKVPNPVVKSFNRGLTTPVRGAFARDQQKLLSLNISNLEALSCDNEFPEKTDNRDFVLSIMIRKGDKPLRTREYRELGIMFSTRLGPYVNNDIQGTVTVLEIGQVITARVNIQDEKLIVTGDCRVPLCAPESASSPPASD